MTSVEVGAKTQWFERRLTLNAAAYRYSYKNQQAASQVGPLGGCRGVSPGGVEHRGDTGRPRESIVSFQVDRERMS